MPALELSEKLAIAGQAFDYIQSELDDRYGTAFTTKVVGGLEFGWFCKTGIRAKVTVHVAETGFLRFCVSKGVFNGMLFEDEEKKGVFLKLASEQQAKIFADVDQPMHVIEIYPSRNYLRPFKNFAMILVNTMLMA
jgi:hypothetical protein